MAEKRKNIIGFLGVIILMLLVSGICMAPCFENGLPYGDDQQIHMLRVESILKAFRTGQGYPIYVYQNMLEGYGYGMGLFYPDIFLLPAVLFRILGAGPELAMKLYIFLILLCTSAASYYAGRYIGGRKYTGIVMMVLYTMGHYHLEDIYIRFALGEAAAMIFIPLAFVSLYDLTERGHSKKGLMCITYACLMLSHTISFILCVILAVLWVVIRTVRISRNIRLVVDIMAEAVMCAAITAYYWLPVLEQFADGSFHVSSDPAFYTHEETLSLLAIVSGKYSVAFIEVGILALLVFASVYKKVYNKKALLCLVAAAVLLICETKLFPWKLVDKTPLVSIQFPWRLNMFTEFFVALGIALQSADIIARLASYRRNVCVCAAGSILIGIFSLNMVWNVELGGYVNYPDGYADSAENTDSIGFWEWLPAEGDLADTVRSGDKYMVSVCGDTLAGVYNRDGSYEFDAGGNPGIYVIPKYYYKGYVAEVRYESGSWCDIQVSKDKENGLVMLACDQGTENVKVEYRGTSIQKISKWVSMISLLVFCLLFIVKKFTDRKGIIWNETEGV